VLYNYLGYIINWPADRLMKTLLNIFIVLILPSLLLCSCSNNAAEDKKGEAKSPTQLYKDAIQMIKEESYKKAAEIFGEITYQYPYYNGAARAQIMEIYAHYLAQDYDNLLPTAENFIKVHPASPDIPYVYYMKALSYYDQIELPQRDQEMTREAKQAFNELIMRFPTSDYAKDAKVKLVLIDDHLAAQEMVIGRFYLNNGDVLGAINRFKTVLTQYPTTSHIEEALYRLTESYVFLGLKDEAKKYAAVLGHNYSNSHWYKDSYKLVK